MRKYRGSCHCSPVRFEIETDFFDINVFCLDGFEPAGIPVRQAAGAAMK